MPIATLSRWTMCYFAAALACLAAAEGLMAAGVGYPSADVAAPETLVVVHLVAIGWLSLAMAGALLQFVPVLVSRPLAFPRLALPTLGALASGLLGLLAGFGMLAGWMPFAPGLLPGAGLLLLAGFALLVLMLGTTIAGARPILPFARFVLVGLACLLATVASGIAFAALLSGSFDWPGAAGLLVDGVHFHALLGFGGWLGLTAFGVGYRLFAMFLLAPDPPRRRVGAVLASGTAALALAAAALVLLAAGYDAASRLAGVVLAGLALATALHGRDVFTLYRTRHRKRLDLNMQASLGAQAALGIGMALLPLAVLLGADARSITALAILLVLGWLSGLTLSQLVKIVPFMTWLEAYGPFIGRIRTPQVSDLLCAPRARLWLGLHFAGTAAGALGVAAGGAGAFRLAMLACLAGTLGLGAELVRVRRLAEIEPARRPPEEARPRLLLPPRSPRRTADDPFAVAPRSHQRSRA